MWISWFTGRVHISRYSFSCNSTTVQVSCRFFFLIAMFISGNSAGYTSLLFYLQLQERSIDKSIM